MSLTSQSGTRSIAGVIGSPVGHSRSPHIMRAAFGAMGLGWDFEAFHVEAGEARHFIESARVLRLAGLSVTMPLKYEVLASLDRVSPEAATLQSVNCIAWEDNELVGYNTDGGGFVDSLVEAGVDPAGGPAVVLGAGGAARAIVAALAAAGCPEVSVVNRSRDNAERAVQFAGDAGRIGSASDIESAALLVNATSVGMANTAGEGQIPVSDDLLRADLAVADIVYSPLETPLLSAAGSKGANAVDGLGMLVGQAARAFTLWTGEAAPLDEMRAGAEGD